MKSMAVILSLVCILANVCGEEVVEDKKFIHAHELQDLESPQTPHSFAPAGPGDYNSNPYLPHHSTPVSDVAPQSSSSGQYIPQSSSSGQYTSQSSSSGQYTPQSSSSGQYTPPSSSSGQYTSQSSSSGQYTSQSSFSPQHTPQTSSHGQYTHQSSSDGQYVAPNSAPVSNGQYSSQSTPAVEPLPTPVVHAPATNPVYTQSPLPQNTYGPHFYAAAASTYSGPQQTWTDLENKPVIILVKNPSSLSYDMAYASTGLGNLDRDTNSQLIAKLLLQHSDKVGVLYPTNGFPLNSFPDFPIGSLILPQDMSLAKIFSFYPRYVPILYLYSSVGYQKVSRETNLAHLGQYKYE